MAKIKKNKTLYYIKVLVTKIKKQILLLSFSGQNRKNKTLYYIKVLVAKIEKTKL